MSFGPPGNSPLDAELAKARAEELEARAERYAELHPGEGERRRSTGRIRGAMHRVRSLILGRSRSS